MATSSKGNAKSSGKRIRPSLDTDNRQNRMISLAMDQAERQLAEGTASSQVVTHYLRLAASQNKDKIELEKLREEVRLLQARTQAIQDSKDVKEMYTKAMEAMLDYSGKKDDQNIF